MQKIKIVPIHKATGKKNVLRLRYFNKLAKLKNHPETKFPLLIYK